MKRAFVVGVLGAESTGKSDLVEAMARRLADQPGWTAADIGVVPEVLRAFCDRAGRTPRRDEQASIAEEQARRITEAAARHRLVLADTTGLMTAVYSEYVFGDRSLYRTALERHAGVDRTLVTALDLPWLPDGLQRDGPFAREPVDALLRQALLTAGIEWSVIHGIGAARVDAALSSLRPALLARGEWPGDAVLRADRSNGDGDGAEPRSKSQRIRWRSACECCTEPQDEPATPFSSLTKRAARDRRR